MTISTSITEDGKYIVMTMREDGKEDVEHIFDIEETRILVRLLIESIEMAKAFDSLTNSDLRTKN